MNEGVSDTEKLLKDFFNCSFFFLNQLISYERLLTNISYHYRLICHLVSLLLNGFVCKVSEMYFNVSFVRPAFQNPV